MAVAEEAVTEGVAAGEEVGVAEGTAVPTLRLWVAVDVGEKDEWILPTLVEHLPAFDLGLNSRPSASELGRLVDKIAHHLHHWRRTNRHIRFHRAFTSS